MAFKIQGKERRALKKERSLLKSLKKNFWHHEDICEAYGAVPDPEWQQKTLTGYDRQIEELNKKLEETDG